MPFFAENFRKISRRRRDRADFLDGNPVYGRAVHHRPIRRDGLTVRSAGCHPAFWFPALVFHLGPTTLALKAYYSETFSAMPKSMYPSPRSNGFGPSNLTHG